MLNKLWAIFSETCKQMDCELLEFGGEHDHVHAMVTVHPKLAVSNLVRCVSVGGASMETVKKYIEGQRTPPSEKAVKTSKRLSQQG